MCIRSQEFQVACQQQMVLNFRRRTTRDLKKSDQLSIGPPPAAFGDISTNRNGRPSKLAGQAVYFLPRESSRCVIDRQRQLVRFLPNLQFFEIFQSASRPKSWLEA